MLKFQCPFKQTFEYSFVVSKEKPSDLVSLAYEKAIDNLLYANIDDKYKVVSIMPTMKHDHQANLVVNLAYQLKKKNQKVLVIDLDFRTPRLQVVLQSGMDRGIYHHLFKGLDAKKTILHDKTYGFDVILVGQEINSVTQVLESKKLSDFIETMKSDYDVILLISPSLAYNKDGLSIAKLSDGILYIVSKKYSNKQIVDSSYLQLKQLQVPILGSLLIDYKEHEKILGIPLL